MKKALLSFVVLVLFAFSAAAQNTTQPQTNELKPQPTKVVPPDLSKLYPIENEDEFFVLRAGVADWTKHKEEGDFQIFILRVFSKNGGSSELAALAVYPFEEKEPCIISWKKDGDQNITRALILENGEAVTTENPRIDIEPIVDDNSNLIGVRLYLVSERHPQEARIAKREIFIKKTGGSTPAPTPNAISKR